MKWTVGLIIFSVSLLVVLGLLALYSVTYSKWDGTRSSIVLMSADSLSAVGVAEAENAVDKEWSVSTRNIQGMDSFKRQAFFVLLGAVCCAIIALWFDYKLLQQKWIQVVLLLGSMLLLTIVFIPQLGGVSVKGSHRWIHWGVNFQPSELAKLSVVIFLSWYGSKYPAKIPTFWGGLIFPMLVVSGVVLLIFLEPDAGTTFFLLAIISSMLLVMGARWRYLLVPAGTLLILLCIWLYNDPVRSARLLSWLDVEGTKQGVGLQAYSSLVAFGSGGWFGKGLGAGEVKMGFLPEDHTDFILPIIGEELGLVTVLLIISLFVLLLICGFKVASRSRDLFGTYLAIGITLMLVLQAVINIGVVTSLLPNKGMPLPFISRGGTNIVMLMISVGLLLAIALRGNKSENLGPIQSQRTILDEREIEIGKLFKQKKGDEREK